MTIAFTHLRRVQLRLNVNSPCLRSKTRRTGGDVPLGGDAPPATRDVRFARKFARKFAGVRFTPASAQAPPARVLG